MWYAQTDPRWSNQRLGTCDGVTIGSDGCFITAYANMANDCGKDVTPAQLDDLCTNHYYVDGCLCTDDLLTKIYPDIAYQWSKSYDGPADLTQLNNDASVKQILEVDGYPATPGLQTHFVYFHHIDDGTVWIVDSETGLLADLSLAYGDPQTAIYKIITYAYAYPKTTTPPPPPPIDPAPAVPPTHDSVSAPVEQPVIEHIPPLVTPAPMQPQSGDKVVTKKGNIMNKYRKTLVAVVAVVVAGLVHQFGNSNSWVQLLIGLLGAAGVYQLPNEG